MAANTAQERNKEYSQLVVAEQVVSNTNSKNRRSHNTAERINCISKVQHVLEPPEDTGPSLNIYNRFSGFYSSTKRPYRGKSRSYAELERYWKEEGHQSSGGLKLLEETTASLHARTQLIIPTTGSQSAL
jgi:hypothetical protein